MLGLNYIKFGSGYNREGNGSILDDRCGDGHFVNDLDQLTLCCYHDADNGFGGAYATHGSGKGDGSYGYNSI